MRNFMWSCVLAVALTCTAVAQFETATVLGTITDPSGAVIAQSEVSLENLETGVRASAMTDSAGNYQFFNVRIGIYQVTAEQEGFKTALSDPFTVTVSARQRVSLSLEVGEASETIEVVGAALLIQADSSERATVIGAKQAVDLPLNGRSYADLTLLTPGTTQALRGSLAGRDASYHVNGLRSSFNNFTLDGVDNNHYGTSNQGFSSQVVQLSPDAVGEFKVVTNNYSAEYGKAGGAIINAAYRSGTNMLHFTLWEFLRNTELNAVGFFKPQSGKPQFKQNQFGVSAGGPIVKNKVFIFGDYEGRRRRQSELTFADIATAEVRNGIIGAPIVDPLTGNPYGGQGDVVPESRRQFYAGRLFQDLPMPNRPGTANNLETLPSEKQDEDKGNIKVDAYVNESLTVFGRYSYRELNWFDPDEIPGLSGGDSNGDILARNLGIVGGTTWTITPRDLLEVRVGFTHSRGGKLPVNFNGPPTGETYQIPNVPNDAAIGGGSPATTVGGFNQMGRQRSNPQYQDPDNVNPRVNYSKIAGNHTVKFGYEAQIIHTNINDLGPTLPNFRFQGRFSEADSSMNPSGFDRDLHNFADYWVGAQSELQLTVNDTLRYRQHMHFGYIQDDWKVNPKVTLNLGLRYELATPQWEKNNLLGNFDPSNNSLVFAQDGSIRDRALVDLDKNNFAPRIGGAYQVTRNTVLRSAFGMSYIHFNRMGGENILGFTGPFIFRVNKTQSAPRFLGSGGVPTCPDGDLSGFKDCFILTQQGIPNDFLSTDQYDPSIIRVNMQPFDNRTGYVQTWHFTIQQQFANDWAFDIGYVGNRGRNQLILSDFNQARPAAVGENLTIDQRRPIDNFSQIQIAYDEGRTSYNALQAKLEKRFSDGFYLLNSFTWSKALDNGAGHLETFNGDNSRINFFNPESEYGVSSYDTPVNNVTSLIWDLPYGRNRIYGGDINPFLNAIIGGWRTTLINTMRKGYPINVSYSPSSNLQTCSACTYRPNYAGGELVNSGRPIDNFFNENTLSEPGLSDPGQPFGSLGRNVARSHSFFQADFGLFKEFQLPREGSRVEFRAEFFNLFNRTNFLAPNSNYSSGGFGNITSTFPARQIQFALKLYY